jgi:hypothetical protein
VTNAGTIMAQNGQIILAGGGTTLITPLSTATGVATALQVQASGAPVTNAGNGLLISNDGAVTLAGNAVSDLGGIDVTTSVTRPGSVNLSTVGSSGNIVLGPGSVVAILPDETSGTIPTGTANSQVSSGTASYFSQNLQPQIMITSGGGVDVQPGALIKAPSASMTVDAGGSGTVLFEAGSTIDLSGLAGVTLPMSDNLVTILLTANEVADTPLARSLVGQTVTIDARLSGTRADGFQWVGSPILDASGYVGLIPESIDQVLTVGGSLSMTGQNVMTEAGSAVNLSGGFVQYTGGMVKTSRLLGTDGHVYNIGSANPNVGYVGIAGQVTITDQRWNVSNTYTASLVAGGYVEPGYIAGASAGSISVAAQVPILEGAITGDIVAGSLQRAAAQGGGTTPQTSLSQLPDGASLAINFTGASSQEISLEPEADAGPDPYGLVAGGFSFATASQWMPVLTNGASPIFSDLLTTAELGAISIKGANQLTMTSDATLSVLPGGKITLNGVSAIGGTLNAPAGTISLTGFTYATGEPQQPPTPAVVIEPGAVLNVRGLWVNDSGLTPAAMQGPAFINGGSVSITTLAASNGPAQSPSNNAPQDFTDVTQSIVLSPGSVIDVSSGGYVGTTGTLKLGSDGLPAGKGGSVTLTTYSGGWAAASGGGLPNPFNSFPTLNVPNQANVSLGGTIYAQGFDGGGTFSLLVPIITIDGAAAQVTSPAGTPGEIVLPRSFFTSGFSQYTLTSLYGSTTITAGTQLVLRGSSFLPTGSENQIPTGAVVRSVEPAGFLPDGLRKPVSLTLVEDAFDNGLPSTNPQSSANDPVSSTAGILIDSDASIVADPQATISLVAGGPVTVLGSIVAQGGVINLINDSTRFSLAAADVWIGPNAVLDVSGTFVANPQVTAFSTGAVLDGGTITLSAGAGAGPSTIVVQPGAQIDLQGAEVPASSALIQVPNTNPSGPRFVSEAEWSNGGNLQLAAANIYFAGTVAAAGGAPLATGGTLTVGNVAVPSALTSMLGSTTPTLPSPNAIVVEPAGVIAANLPAASSGRSYPRTPSDLSAMAPSTPGAFIGADTLSNSGFDSVNLNAMGNSNSSIAFGGSVTVSVPGALTLWAQGGSFVLLPTASTLLPSGVSNPASFMPFQCGPAGSCIPSIGGAVVNLNAGYVRFVGVNGIGSGKVLAPPNVADGTLNVTAQWIDLERAIALDNVGNASLTSTGAIRLLPDNYGFINGSGTTVPDPNDPGRIGGVPQTIFGGALVAPGNLTLGATEIFPVSNTQFLLMSIGTLASDSTVTVKQNGAATAPLSAGGTIALDAQTIVQDGTLWAPLGGIVIGLQSASQVPLMVQHSYAGPFAVTQSVTLGSGSLTSVSAAGLDIPDGYTIDGTTWYQGVPGGSDNLATVLAAPPAKSIGIFGANVSTQAGAVIDLSGGGDIYATEYVSGTGGTRNVLTSYEQNLSTGLFTPQYANGRQVYALVPSYEAPVAAYDPNFAHYPYYSGLVVPSVNNGLAYNNGIAPGTSITIAGGSGIPAGTYTLLPGMYATLPGAYRVVQAANNVNPTATAPFTSADGSQYISGTFSNTLTGTRSSQQTLFQLQSRAVWSQYSQINITSGTSFFRNQALTNGVVPPPLPIDGGILTFGATSTLSLLSTNRFAPGTSDLAPGLQGAGGQVDIAAQNILILSSDLPEPVADADAATPYLVLDADQISNLGAASVLIGGTAAPTSTGVTITADALNLEVATDAAHPLTGPELTLVSLAPNNADPGVHGITVDAGSVIQALGTVPAGTDRNITIGALPVLNTANNTYSGQASGDGSLLRVSDGTTVSVTRLYVPGLYTGPGPVPTAPAPLGQITIGTAPGTADVVAGASVVIDGGNALTIDSSGSNRFAPSNGGVPGAVLVAQNYDLSASIINVGGGSAGLILDPGVIANFAGATSVTLRSASVFNLFDAGGLTFGDPGNPIGTLIFDGAGLFSQGGATTIDALNVVLTDSQSTPNTSGALSGPATGALKVDAGGIFTASAGAVTLGNFAQVNATASEAIAFSGSGSLDAGTANVSLTAPVLLVHGGSTQSLTTTGAVAIAQAAGTAPPIVATDIGGALTITAGSIADSGTIQALSGNVTLNATEGDVVLDSGAKIDAGGSHIAILDVVEDAPGGSVKLVSNTGNVTIGQDATVDVSATGNGYAGSLTIIAPGTTDTNGNLVGGTATLTGTLIGGANFKDAGGNFVLNAGSLIGTLPFQGFTGSFSVALQAGNIDVPAGTTLSSGLVNLTANNGSVTVEGTIDASGSSGGAIALYGAAGVTVNQGALLNASYHGITDPRDPGWANGASTLDQNGGTITLGTTGTPTGDVDTTGCGGTGCGYEIVASSGAIIVAAGAVLDVSGGPGTTNVPYNGSAISNNAGTIILHAPILASGNVNVGFHGTVVAAGNTGPNSGVVLDAYAVWSTGDTASTGGQHFDGIIDPAGFFDGSGNQIIFPINGLYPTSTPANPAAGAYIPHIDFYQTTLVNFIQDFNTQADFTGAQLQIGGSAATVALPSSLQHNRPEIDLINPDTRVNNGNITVASNWNFGAGTVSGGGISLTYRTQAGEPGVLMLRAVNSVQINATISDGFFFPQASGNSATQAYANESANLFAYDQWLSGDQLRFSCSSESDCPASGFFTADQMFGNGYIPSSLLGPFALQPPTIFSSGDPNLIDQYNQFYVQYIHLFDTYQQEFQIDVGFYEQPSAPATVLPPAPPTAANYYSYYDFVNGAQPGIDGSGNATGSTGSDYVSQYEAYFIQTAVKVNDATYDGSNFASLAGTDLCLACVAYAPPFPPNPQLAFFSPSPQPGFTPTPAAASLPGNQIANNPAIVNGTAYANTTAAANLMPVGSGNSFSYDFVAGAFFAGGGNVSVDPSAVIPVSALTPATAGNVTISGHTSYPDVDAPATDRNGNPLALTIVIPTLVRTGTGSITIAAAGNVEFLDSVAPGAVYTAGAATTTPSDFAVPAVPGAYVNQPNGLVNTPTWATGGGPVAITAGQSIIGTETPTDNSLGSQTGVPNGPTGQFWSDWYEHYGLSNGTDTPFAGCAVACQTSAWVNYATFFQGFGALGGGNVALTAGGNIVDVAASLPETLVVGGGVTASDPPHATYFGGGNLVVNAGGDLLSSDFLVGRGSGFIRVGGSAQADLANPITGLPTALPLLLAVQDGFISVAARGSVTLGNVFDPASLPLDGGLLTDYNNYLPGALPPSAFSANMTWGELFTTFGPESGVSLTSTNGDVTALTLPVANGAAADLFLHNTNVVASSVNSALIGLMLPATIDLFSLTGNIDLNTAGIGVGNANLMPYPTEAGDNTGTIDIIAAESISLGAGLAMPDLDTALTQYVGFRGQGINYASFVSPLGVPQPNLTQALHANDPVPVIIAAGQDIIANASTGTTLSLLKPAEIEAGRNIVGNGLSFIGENNNPGDITSIAAGNDLVGGSYVLYGPGTFVLQAGHDMGPFEPSTIFPSGTWGIATIGDGSAVGDSFEGPFALPVRPYLPSRGAGVDVLFGVGPGIDYAAAISAYVNPANAGTDGINYLADIANILGESPQAAWATFQGLSQARQDLLVDRAFLDFLTQVAADYRSPASPYFAKYGRAYETIATLFPAAYGYTDNAAGTGGNGAARMIATGKLDIASSVLETQTGGDINIIGPGGGIIIGHSSRDVLNPAQEGILTLAGGSIRSFTDASVLLNQSRIMTEQGGDIDVFSANGDISAGEGPKTYVSDPPISLVCDVSGYCYVNPQGLVTGAGIGALVTLPGQDPSKSNVTLVAPHGTVDAGAAGIRVAGNLNIVALQVLNAFNLNVGGTISGIPQAVSPNIGALATASSAAGQAAAVANQAATAARHVPATQDLPSIITVEVVGYGGATPDEPQRQQDRQRRDEERRRKSGQQGYNSNSAFQVIGLGDLTR